MIVPIIINCETLLVAFQGTFTCLVALLLDILCSCMTRHNYQGYRSLKLFQEVVFEVLAWKML